MFTKRLRQIPNKKEFIYRLPLLLMFFLLVSLAWGIGTSIGWIEYICGRPLNTPPVIFQWDAAIYNTPSILVTLYGVIWMISWASIPMFYYFLFPKQKYYHLLKCTAVMCVISVIIYIAYPTYDDKFYLYNPLSRNATLFGETPSFHTMNSMILCLACIPMKKSKGQIILFIIALVLFITVVPTAIYTNRHYSIDIITSIVLVSLVWLIFYFYKTPRLDNKILFFFEVIISRKFLLNSNKVPVKYLLILASPFVLLGGVDITMMFASVVM